MVFAISASLCGVLGMILAVITLYRRYGFKRGLFAVILAGIDLVIVCAFLSRFPLQL